MYEGNQGESEFGSSQRESTVPPQPLSAVVAVGAKISRRAETICMTCKVQIQTVYRRIALNVTVKFQALRYFRAYNLQTSGVVACVGPWNLPEANGYDKMVLFFLLLLLLLRLLLSGFKKLRRGLVYVPKIKSSHTTAFQSYWML